MSKEKGKKEEVQKGFLSGYSDGGFHAHTLVREEEKTKEDGSHRHVFIIPTDEGSIMLMTEDDGSHEHYLWGTDADDCEWGSEHSHEIKLTDGTVLKTDLGGYHYHRNMLETTGLDGPHRHTITLPNGVKLISLTPGEFYRFFPTAQKDNPPLLSADSISDLIGGTTLAEQIVEMAKSIGLTVEKKNQEEERTVQAKIVKTDMKKRLVYGVVLEPLMDEEGQVTGEPDTHDDVYKASEIEKSAHFYLKNGRVIGDSHETIAGAHPVESYIAPVEFTLEEEVVKAGTWIIVIKVDDDELLDRIEKGELAALSMGGFGRRRKI